MVDWRPDMGSFVSKSEYFWSRYADLLGDVTFLVGPDEEKIKGFKYPLMVTSPKFESMFRGTLTGSRGQDEPIKLPHADPTIFRYFLQLLLKDTVTTEYLDTLNLSMKQIMDIFFVSKEYVVHGVQQALEVYIRKNTNVDTALDIYDELREKDEEKLELDTLDFITRNTKQLVEQESFLTVSKTIFLSILAQACNVDELTLFKTACRWAESHCQQTTISDDEPAVVQSVRTDVVKKKKSVRKIVRELLSEIRLPLLTIQEFAIHVRPTGVLDSEETNAIYDYYATKNFTENQESFVGQTKLILSDILTVRLDPRSRIRTLFLSDPVSDPVFQCTDRENFIWLTTSKDILIHGYGFCGPLSDGSEYDVKIWKTDLPPVVKKIFAKKGSIFHVTFSTPVFCRSACWQKLNFSLKGAPTGSTARNAEAHGTVQLKHDGIIFEVNHVSRQIVEIQYSLA